MLHMEKYPLGEKEKSIWSISTHQRNEKILSLKWVRKAETNVAVNPTPRAMTHNQTIRRELKTWSCSHRSEVIEAHIGHLAFYDLFLRDEFPKHLPLKRNRACIHETHWAMIKWETVLKGSTHWGHSAEAAVWKAPRHSVKDAYLLTLKCQPEEQASILAHV